MTVVQCSTAAQRAPTSSGVLPEELAAGRPSRPPVRVCARCRAQVLLCSRWDRGQRYCGRSCSRAARLASLRIAACRYPRSWGGRIAHAARSRRWRRRCRERAQQQAVALEAAALSGGPSSFVTHQGSPTPSPDAPLPSSDEHAEVLIDTSTSPSTAQCRRCRSVPRLHPAHAATLPHAQRRAVVRHSYENRSG